MELLSGRVKLFEREIKQGAEVLVAVDGAWFVQMSGDLESGEPVEEHPEHCREFSARCVAERAGGLRVADNLFDRVHSVVGCGLQLRAWLGQWRIAEDELVVVGILKGMLDVGHATRAKPRAGIVLFGCGQADALSHLG